MRRANAVRTTIEALLLYASTYLRRQILIAAAVVTPLWLFARWRLATTIDSSAEVTSLLALSTGLGLMTALTVLSQVAPVAAVRRSRLPMRRLASALAACTMLSLIPSFGIQESQRLLAAGTRIASLEAELHEVILRAEGLASKQLEVLAGLDAHLGETASSLARQGPEVCAEGHPESHTDWESLNSQTHENPTSVGGSTGTFPAIDVPSPGTILDASNLERWKELVIPAIQWAVRRGARLEVVANEPLPMEPARAEATRRYSSRTELSGSKDSLVNYVAGIPFPFVRPDDADAGVKMILNWDARFVQDDLDSRNLGCQTGTFSATTGLQIERNYLTEHFRRLYYVSRLYIEPRPTWPSPQNIRYREMMHPVVEPLDLKGAGFSYTRFLDPGRPDDSWLYFPQTKRVRRLSAAQRSLGVFGQDIDLDSFSGYSGNPAWMEWRLLGTKTALATLHGRTARSKFLPEPNDFLHDDVWEPREIWVIEGRSLLGSYASGRRVVYIDRESFITPYTEIYDHAGRLWKGLVQNWADRDKTRPQRTQKVGYTSTVISTVSMFDVQIEHATRCQFPDESSEEGAGWYINVGDQGGVTESSFDVVAFIGASR